MKLGAVTRLSGFLATVATLWAIPLSSTATETELIVLYAQAAAEGAATAEQIVDAVNDPVSHPGAASLLERLQRPSSARLLIGERIDHARRAQLSNEDPAEILQRYVVLDYPNAALAELAKKLLAYDPNIISVQENAPFSFSVIPSDPLAYPGGSENYQWGLSTLNLYAAWDKTTGFGYVGDIDNGIQPGHPNLTNARIQFWKNFGVGASIDEADYGGAVYPYAGHGSHVAGLIAATSNDGIGTAGVCWGCTLMITKATIWNGSFPQIDNAAAANAMNFLVHGGAQVVNMSWGSTSQPTCSTDPNQAMCTAMQYAQNRDVVLVASAGNTPNVNTQWPASDSRVLAVGGVQLGNSIWYESGTFGSSWVPYLGTDPYLRGVVAPAKNVYSTFYTGRDWNPAFRCGDNSPSSANPGYGWCTGTSMASPQVAGLGALLRSANPLLTTHQIRQYITSNSDHFSAPNASWGVGIPNAYNAVSSVIATTGNRLTPLFAFYGSYTRNYFYTTSPQQGAAAIDGFLMPYVNAAFNTYGTVGNPVNIFPAFAGISGQPRAQVWIFTTPQDPVNPSIPLVPLYRLSYKCGDTTGNPACTRYPYHTDHTYTTDQAGINAYISVGYKFDGIEGYLYPNTMAQPPGTTKLYRKYNSDSDDHAIFPESQLAAMTAAGYTLNSGAEWIGWAYENTTGNRPSY
jgi:serine protease